MSLDGATASGPVVVVGGGIAGLVAAWELRLAGFDVELVEASGRCGGPLLTGEVGGVVVDLGAESFLARRPEALDLVAELGLWGDLVHPARSTPMIHRDGVPHPLAPGTVFGVPADPALLAGVLTAEEIERAVAEVDVAWTGDVSVAEFVGQRLGEAVVERLVDPLLGGVYAGRAAALSAQATLPQLVVAVKAGSTLRAAVRAVTGAVGPGRAPVFGGLSGGVGRLVTSLVDRFTTAGGRVWLGEGVVCVARERGAWSVTSRTADGGLRTRPAAGVVLATPAPVAGRLLSTVAPGAAAGLAGIDLAAVAVVALAVPVDQLPVGRLPDDATSGVLVPAVEGSARGLAVKAMTFSSAKWGWVAAQDPTLAIIRASIGRAGEPGGAGLSDTDLVALARRDAGVLLGVQLRVADAVVARWPGALPQYPVGHVSAMARVSAEVDGHPGLALAGAVLAGVGIPACIATGRAAASKVIIDLTGRASLDELDDTSQSRFTTL